MDRTIKIKVTTAQRSWLLIYRRGIKAMALGGLLTCSALAVQAQQTDFCDAITAILRDAPNKFRDIRGKKINASQSALVWESGIKVPGTIASRFVAQSGIFYQGAVFQTRDIYDLKDEYLKYKKILDACLLPKGMTLSASDNFKPGLSQYKKLSYLPPLEGEASLEKMTGHVAMDVDYSKDTGYYTILIFIYEH